MKSFKLWLGLLLGPFLLNPSSFSQGIKSSPPTTKLSLWKVQGQSNSVHLFGSIHFLKKSFYPLPEPIEEAYRQSQVVVFEADLDEMDSVEAQRKVVQLGSYPAGETLPQNLSKETYNLLRVHLQKSRLPTEAFDSYRPWMVAVNLLGIELQKLGYSPEEGVDKYFLTKAKRDGKKVISLETLEFQLGLFGQLSKEEQEAMLKESLENTRRFKTVVSEMIQAWKTGNSEKLDALILHEMREYPQLYQKFLVERNQRWAERIEQMLKEGRNVFVVVGAAHLVGKESVVELLKKRKFSGQQIGEPGK